MNTKKTEFGVGLFMLAGLVVLLVLALKVSGLSGQGEGETYTVQAQFSNIGGLKVRSPVKIGGVVVGRVTAIELDPTTQVPKVTLAIQKSAGELAQTSTLNILTSGLLGEQYLGLVPGFTDEAMGIEVLKDGDMIEDTKSAIVLEELIGKFLYSSKSE